MKKIILMALLFVFILAFTTSALAKAVRPVVFTCNAVLNEQKQIVLTLSVSENGDFVSGFFEITFATGIIKFIEVQKTDIGVDLVETAGDEDGRVKVAFADDEAINAGGEFMRLLFDLNDPGFEGYIVFGLKFHELIDTDTVSKVRTEAYGCTIAVGENPQETFAPPTPPPTPQSTPTTTYAVTNSPANPSNTPNYESPTPAGETSPSPAATDFPDVPESEAPDGETPVPSETNEEPVPPVTGDMTLLVVSVFSGIAGLGAVALRKKEQ